MSMGASKSPHHQRMAHRIFRQSRTPYYPQIRRPPTPTAKILFSILSKKHLQSSHFADAFYCKSLYHVLDERLYIARFYNNFQPLRLFFLVIQNNYNRIIFNINNSFCFTPRTKQREIFHFCLFIYFYSCLFIALRTIQPFPFIHIYSHYSIGVSFIHFVAFPSANDYCFARAAPRGLSSTAISYFLLVKSIAFVTFIVLIISRGGFEVNRPLSSPLF